MCALLSLGTFFLFCSFESVLFWKYYKRVVVFFLQNQFSVNRSRVLEILTSNLQPANYTLRHHTYFVHCCGFASHVLPAEEANLPSRSRDSGFKTQG